MNYKKINSIKTWAEEDRPREKMMLKGKSALTDAELLAILIGSGNKDLSAVDIAKLILGDLNGSLKKLGALSVDQLINYHGVGPASASKITAIMELGRRYRSEVVPDQNKITSSNMVFEFMQAHLSDLSHEEFWIVLLNRSNKLISKICISQGGFAGTVADPKKIFSIALEKKASSLILCHNHPSGNVNPSEADIKLTKKIVEGGKLFDMPVLDHIIVGVENYYSFADRGQI